MLGKGGERRKETEQSSRSRVSMSEMRHGDDWEENGRKVKGGRRGEDENG